MKKIIMIIFIFLYCMCFKVYAQEIQVLTYANFTTYYQSSSSKTIVLGNNIIFTDNNLGNIGGYLYIKGNGNYLGTNSGTKYNGFRLSVGKTLTLENVEIRGTNQAIIASNAVIDILNGISLNNNSTNSGYNGGAIFNENNSKITFKNGNITFTGNIAIADGGAIYNTSNSQINFEMSSGNMITFNNNTATVAVYGMGGAIHNNYNSIVTFRNGNIMFTGNTAYLGGAILNTNNSQINFEMTSGDTVIFNNNTVAIYNQSNSTITFSNCDITFAGNNSSAITNSSEIIFRNGNIMFTENMTTGSGGAIYNSGSNGLINFDMSGGLVIFSSNTATYYGGAIYNINSEMNFINSNIMFIGNIATHSGGALFILNSTVTFNTNGGEALFRGNKANGKPNDVYMDTDAKLNISGSNTIRFEGGIVTSSTNVSGIEINKSGAGAMYLGGENEIWGDFNITDGDIIMLADATYEGKAFKLGSTSALDMHNETENTINVTGKFESMNNLKMDIFTDGNDEIRAGSAEIGGNIDIFAGVGIYDNTEFELIITSNSLTGAFSSSSINYGSLTYELKYESGIVKLIVDGMNVTDFKTLTPLSLTYNQSETAKAFDKLSAKAGAWKIILAQMKDKQTGGTAAEIAEIKDFMAQTSGYFLANVIRNIASDSSANEIYDKIRNNSEEYKTNDGMWMQLKGGIERFKKDENSPEDYRDVSMGVMFGFDRFLAGQLAGGDAMWGVFGRINKDNIEQGKHKADGNKNGLGVYGGYIIDGWEFKAMLLGSYDKFVTERMTYEGDTAKADISAMTVSADAEVALKIELTESVKLKPYAAIAIENAMYGGFKEKGAGIYNLDVEKGNYFRSAARMGAGIDYEKEIWTLYANIESKYKIKGTKPEIESRFENTDIKFNSRGVEEGKIEIGIGAGAAVKISENWKIFVNGKYYAGERYENLHGNTGVRYMLENKNSVFLEDAKKKFNEAKKLYNKGEYLRATDMLSEIMISYPDYKPPVRLHKKIQKNMNKTAESKEELDFSKLTYAKGYCAYYKSEYVNALGEWTKYVHFTGGSDEINEYINKIKDMLKLKDSINREAELDAKANDMLNAGIAKYKASKWVPCIKDMEALQKFVTQNEFLGTGEYYNKAKEYIVMSVNELTKAIKTEKKKENKPKEPELKIEVKPKIDEAEADKKYNEGLMLYAQGKYLEAERAWELVLRLNPNHQKAKIALSRLRSDGHLTE